MLFVLLLVLLFVLLLPPTCTCSCVVLLVDMCIWACPSDRARSQSPFGRFDGITDATHSGQDRSRNGNPKGNPKAYAPYPSFPKRSFGCFWSTKGTPLRRDSRLLASARLPSLSLCIPLEYAAPYSVILAARYTPFALRYACPTLRVTTLRITKGYLPSASLHKIDALRVRSGVSLLLRSRSSGFA